MKIQPVFILLILLLFIQCDKSHNLTTKQKVQDFEYLYQILEENYPFFGVTKREKKIDWLANKDEYLKQIKATPDDSAYFATLCAIINELGCPHLGIGLTLNYDYGLEVYKKQVGGVSKYDKWVKVFEEGSTERAAYWRDIANRIWDRPTSNQPQVAVANYTDSILPEDKIGIMRINSFSYEGVATDSLLITSFLEKAKGLDHLIIDIQRNSGGSSRYWRECLVSKLVEEPVSFPRNQIAKDGAMNRYFYPEFFESSTVITKENLFLYNTPPEIFDGTYYLSSTIDTINPNQPVPFKGKIYLLVSEYVCSASDDFAYFCKASGWATVAGVRTAGEGGCGEPTLFILPHSGIILNHPSVSGLNLDGSFNFETRTLPDVKLQGGSLEERLDQLIAHIKQQQR